MIPRAATRTKIESAARALAREFGFVPPGVIELEVEAIASRLLEHARFDDFVPTLAHRYVREGLRDRKPASPLADAA